MSLPSWSLQRELGGAAGQQDLHHLRRRLAPFLCGATRCLARNEFSSIDRLPPQEQGTSYPSSFPPTYALRFCPVPGHSDVLALANEDGCVALQDTKAPRKDGRRMGKMSGHRAHLNACFDVCWPGGDASRLASASADLSCRLWDLSSGRFRMEAEFKGHTRSVNAVDFAPGSDYIVATASKDNSVRVWDRRTGKCENSISRAHTDASSSYSNSNQRRPVKRRRTSAAVGPTLPFPDQSSAGSVTALAFVGDSRLLTCGDRDGVVKVWDLRRHYSLYQGEAQPAHRLHHPGDSSLNGFTSLALGPHGLLAHAACRDGRVYQWELASMRPLPSRAFIGCQIGSFYNKISLGGEGGGVLACGSADSGIYLWDVHSWRGREEVFPPSYRAGGGEKQRKCLMVSPVAALRGHNAEVTCVAWCKTKWRLASCSDDVLRHRLWELNGDESLERDDEVGLLTGAANLEEDSKRLEDRRDTSVITWREEDECFFDLAKARQKGRHLDTLDANTSLRSPRKGVGRSEPRSSQMLSDLPCSPRKMNVTPKKSRDLSSAPRKLVISPKKKGGLFSSPTCDLPNLVRDGRSPHHMHSSGSPRSSAKARSDRGRRALSLLQWLGKSEVSTLSKEKETPEELSAKSLSASRSNVS